MRAQSPAFKQTGSGELFQFVQRFRKSWLAQVKGFSRASQSSLLRNGDKCMKVAQPNALTKQTIFSISDVKNRAVRVTSKVICF